MGAEYTTKPLPAVKLVRATQWVGLLNYASVRPPVLNHTYQYAKILRVAKVAGGNISDATIAPG